MLLFEMEEKKLQEIAEDILLACSLSEDSTVLSQLIEKEFNLKDENDKEKIIELIRRSKQNPLIIAAGSGNTESLKLLLEVNEFQLFLKRVDKDGLSVIHAAALSQNADSLLFLLKKTGAKEFLNSPDNRYNFTPLHYAVEHENWEIVEILLKEGALPELLTKNKHTILHLAVKSNLIQILSKIVNFLQSTNQLKKIINYQDINGDTALHIAMRNNYSKCSKILLNAGADLIMKNNRGISPQQARAKGKLQSPFYWIFVLLFIVATFLFGRYLRTYIF